MWKISRRSRCLDDRWDDVAMEMLVSGSIISSKLFATEEVDKEYIYILLSPLLKMCCDVVASLLTWQAS